MKRALVLLFNNVEEIEVIAPIDLLRRADVDVVVASLTNSLCIAGRSNIQIKADCLLADIVDFNFDMLLIPGGPGVLTYIKDILVLNLIKEFNSKGKYIAAICAAPLLLKSAGILDSKECTSHPSVIEEIGGVDKNLVVDANIITSQGPGTSIDFGLKLVELLGKDSDELSKTICYRN